MSSFFKNLASGIQKTPPVCISKERERIEIPHFHGRDAIATVRGWAQGILGPYEINETWQLRREFLHQAFGPDYRQTSNGHWLQILIEPVAAINPIRLHVAFFRIDSPAGADWRADRTLPPYTQGVNYHQRITSWDFEAGTGASYAEIWIR